jgi:hypothetical protein
MIRKEDMKYFTQDPKEIIEIIEIKDIDSFLHMTLQYNLGSFRAIYRGESKKNFLFNSKMDSALIPRIYRILHGKELEKEMLNEFEIRSIPYLKFEYKNKWDLISIAQHYNLPTRLLDWTENPLIALFFTVFEPTSYTYIENKEDGYVWMYVTNEEDYISKDTMDKKDPFDIDRILIFTSRHIDERIVSQSSCFTIHPPNMSSAKIAFEKKLRGFKIAASLKNELRFYLNKLNLKASTIFPGLDKLSDTILLDKSLKIEGEMKVKNTIDAYKSLLKKT